MNPSTLVDPITLAVVKGGLEQIVDEMDAIIVRAAFSPVISEQLDRASGVFHPRTGEVVAQGRLTLPIFMTATTGRAAQPVSFLYSKFDMWRLSVAGRRSADNPRVSSRPGSGPATTPPGYRSRE